MSILDPNATIAVVVKSPEGTLYKGPAIAVSTNSSKGPFDILPYHANLIAIIKDNITNFETHDKKKDIKIEKGFMKVFENTVNIFLGVETIL